MKRPGTRTGDRTAREVLLDPSEQVGSDLGPPGRSWRVHDGVRSLGKIDVNFFGLVELTRKLLPLIRKSESGRIVNVSSILGSLTIQSTDSGISSFKPFAYNASKTAVNAFTVHLAAALSNTPIKVNSAHPGWVRTDMGGPQAPLLPEEGARTAVRLATLGPDGPTGKFFHGDEELPW